MFDSVRIFVIRYYKNFAQQTKMKKEQYNHVLVFTFYVIIGKSTLCTYFCTDLCKLQIAEIALGAIVDAILISCLDQTAGHT